MQACSTCCRLSRQKGNYRACCMGKCKTFCIGRSMLARYLGQREMSTRIKQKSGTVTCWVERVSHGPHYRQQHEAQLATTDYSSQSQCCSHSTSVTQSHLSSFVGAQISSDTSESNFSCIFSLHILLADSVRCCPHSHIWPCDPCWPHPQESPGFT